MASLTEIRYEKKLHLKFFVKSRIQPINITISVTNKPYSKTERTYGTYKVVKVLI